MLPYVANQIPKWKAVTADNFSIGQYDAHRIYADTIRNVLGSKEELEKLLKEVDDEEEEEEDEEAPA